MSSKSQGISGEREIRDQVWERGYTCVRVAASGGTVNPEPDLLISSSRQAYAVEAKKTSKNKVYLSKDEVDQLLYYAANHANCIPLVGARFKGDTTWYFAHPRELRTTEKSVVVDKDRVGEFRVLKEQFPDQGGHVEVKDV